MSPATRWVCAQISDPHVVERGRLCLGEVDTADHLARAVAWIGELDPPVDLVLVSGDCTNDGRAAQYDHLAELLAPLSAPVVLAAGNHDDPAALAAAFPALSTRDGRLDTVVEGPVRTVVLDSTVPGAPGGDLRPEQLRWLDRVLGERAHLPTVVVLHHPPFASGIGHMDAMALAPGAADELEAVVRGHPQVERVVSGHLHRATMRRFAGTVAVTVPSTAMAVALDLRPGGPAAWTREPPVATLHAWTPEQGLVTHHAAIGRFPATGFA